MDRIIELLVILFVFVLYPQIILSNNDIESLNFDEFEGTFKLTEMYYDDELKNIDSTLYIVHIKDELKSKTIYIFSINFDLVEILINDSLYCFELKNNTLLYKLKSKRNIVALQTILLAICENKYSVFDWNEVEIEPVLKKEYMDQKLVETNLIYDNPQVGWHSLESFKVLNNDLLTYEYEVLSHFNPSKQLYKKILLSRLNDNKVNKRIEDIIKSQLKI